MNWKSFLLGLALATGAAALQYAEVLPQPWGALAAFALMALQHFLPSSLTAPKPALTVVK